MVERYARLTLIPWWDQDRLRDAKALVVGAGALGNEIIKNLALLGVGRIHVVDMDRIESSNLSRSALFRQSDVGEYKACVVAKHAMSMNPDVQVIPIVGRFEDHIGLGLLREMDLVFAGLDSRLARLNVGRACRLVGKPWIDGAIEALQGIVRVFGADGPCYECTLNDVDLKLIAKRKSCALITKEEAEQGKTPTTPTMGSIVAGFEVQEGIKMLHESRNLNILYGKGFFINGLTHDSYSIQYTEKAECPTHERFNRYVSIDVDHLGSLKEFRSAVEQILGNAASISLRREIVTSGRCIPCRAEVPLGISPAKWLTMEITCSSCSKPLQPVLAQNLADCELIMERSLAECGVPDRDILACVVGDDVVGASLKPASRAMREAA